MVSQTVTYGWDGGHRIRQPALTLRTLEKLCHATGPIFSCRKLIQAEDPVHIYQARFLLPFAQSSKKVPGQSRFNFSLGKGQTEIQALVSALSEAVERMSAYYRGDEPLLHARLSDLGEAGIHPNDCLLFSEEQYRNRKAINKSLIHTSVRIPEPFADNLKCPWVVAWSLRDEVEKYLPAAYCYYAFPDQSAEYCRMDFNGHAAGNSKEEAMLQGFLELIERDSVALWWYNKAKRPAIDLDSFDLPYIKNLEAYYQSLNREFWVLDVTSDFEIPAFVAISISNTPAFPDEPILYGTGAHFDARIAIIRALTEMNQALPAILAARTSHPMRLEQKKNQERMDYWPSYKVSRESYLRPAPDCAARSFQSFSGVPYMDICEALQYIKKLLIAKGLDLLSLDQTRQDLGLHVVKVVVPGMRPYWRRLAPGRLYEKPVQLGWINILRKEADMNPAPITR